jgi:hypothetical protein
MSRADAANPWFKESPMSPKKVPVATPPRARAQEFRTSILEACADGARVEDMVLRLTLRDAAMLKRDPTVEIDEIVFGANGMEFLGVKVVSGGVPESVLDRAPA